MDPVETQRLGDGRRSRLRLGLVGIGAAAVIGVAAIGRIGSEEVRRPTEPTAVTPAAPTVAAAPSAPPTAARPSAAPTVFQRFDLFASTAEASRIPTPFRLILPTRSSAPPVASSIELTGVLDSDSAQIRVRATIGDATLASVTVPTAVVVRGTGTGVDWRRVFRASVALPPIQGPASLVIDIEAVDPTGPEPQAFVAITTTGPWAIGGYGDPVVPGYVVPGDVTTRP